MNSATFGSVLDRNRGIGPGFDWLRITLAALIAATHINSVVPVNVVYFEFPPVVHFGILYAFFGLSGFLISGSAMRLSLRNFLINRSLRIIPALAVDILLCALILGPIFTTLSLMEYFADPLTYRYFLNILGVISFHLPGVFANNTTDVVNYSLWTVPFEILCYVFMGIFVVLGLLYRPTVIFIIALFWIIAGVAILSIGPITTYGLVAKIIDHAFVLKGSRLLVAFFLGVVAYLVRHRIPYSPKLFIFLIVFCIFIGEYLLKKEEISYPVMSLILAIPFIYITVFIGVSDIWTPQIIKRGDYSYGIYLYHWPIMQAMVIILPPLGSSLSYFALSFPLVVALAIFSWHCIEKPVLNQRRRFSFVAKERLAEANSAKGLAQKSL